MADSNNSEWLSRQHLSRRAALRAAILGATIPGALYLAKAANSADAADGDVYIPGAPNFLELGYGWPGKEENAGKISYRRWSDALDIVGAGTAPGYRNVKIWDDLYVQGRLNLRSYVVDPEVPRNWTAFLYAKDVNGGSKPFWKDATGTAQPLVARSATLVVAASNASPRSKLGADYVCDGVADEEEINAAIAALPAGGGKVVLTEGTFNISDDGLGAHEYSIPVSKDNVIIEGQGTATILFNAAGRLTTRRLLGVTSHSNVTIRNLTIDGNAANQTTCGDMVDFDSATNCLFENVEIKNVDSIALAIGGTSSGITVRRCIVHNTGYTAVTGEQGHAVVLASTTSRCTIEGCEIYDIGVNYTGGGGIGCVGIAVYGVEHVIRGNVIYDGGDDASIRLMDACGCVVVNNQCIAGESAIIVMTETGGVRDCEKNLIIGNSCQGYRKDGTVGYNGIHVQWVENVGGYTCHDNAVVGNVCHNCYCAGILIQGADNNLIANNLIYDTNHWAGWGNGYLSIVDRVGDGSGTGGSYNLIQGNKLRASAASGGPYGIDIHYAACTSNVIKDNDVRGAGATAPIYDNGTSTIIQNNQGYATENSGTATLVNGQTSIAVTHGLAVTPAIGDVMVTPIEAWGAATQYWISAYSSTTFTITVDQDPGQDVDFAWKAVVL